MSWGRARITAALVATLAFAAPAAALPKPDPPPKPHPPPPPAIPHRPPPPVQPVAPPPVTPAPVVAHPTAAERRATAARRRAARARAARAARLRAQRAAAQKRAAAARRARAEKREISAPVGDPTSSSSASSALPYLGAAFAAALLLLGLALTPAWAVPWSRASRLLEERRDELGVIGAMSLLATVVFFLLVQVAK